MTTIGAFCAHLKAGCKVETLRACGEGYVPYGNQTHLEVSGPPFTKACKLYVQQIECSKQFIKDCTDGVPKAAALLGLEAFLENHEAICTIGTKPYEAYQKAIGCINSVGVKIDACMNGIRSGLQKAVVKAPNQDILHYACCSYGDLVDCLEPALAPCEEVGGKEFTLKWMDLVFGEALNLVCGNYKRGSEACKTLPKLPALGPKDRKLEGYIELIIETATAFGRRS